MIKLVNRTFSFHYHDDDDDDSRRLVNFQGGQGSAFVPGSVRIGVDINLVVLAGSMGTEVVFSGSEPDYALPAESEIP